jgi:hypothetical protein
LSVGGSPEGLAVHGGHIYWANNGNAGQSTIGRTDTNGRNVDDDFITGATFDGGFDAPNGVAVDPSDTHIYWGNGDAGAVGRANLDQNGDVSQIDQSFVSISSPSIPPFVLGVAVDPDTVFWADTDNSTVGAAAVSSPFPNPSFIETGEINGVAVDNTFIYWTNHTEDPNFPNRATSSIGRADLNGQNANQQFIPLPQATQPVAVAVDSRSLASPPPTIEHLIQEVTEEGLPHGIENSLLAKLEGAQRKLDAGNLAGACGSLGAYINETQAQSGKKLDTAYAEALVLDATAVREAIGC